ncbi:MAG: M18 family aminopeptidase [Ruminococcaceae bacterium]|nr:M18 family aminopeptidase [Oscillospiraceae bacterium]
MNQALFDYIAASPTAFHAVSHTGALLEKAGYLPLSESDDWALAPGQGYYVTRNLSSLIAFRVPEDGFTGFMMAAAHGDSPAFKIKENAALSDPHYVRLSTEKYGGMLCASWMDRPLSIAGRVLLRTESGVASRLVDLREITVLIPNVAIHMNRNANDGMSYNPAVDMLPLYGLSGAESLRSRIADKLGVSEDEILTTDLFVYNPAPGVQWNELISAPRLDDLQCAFGALQGFLQAKNGKACPVYCLFDNEEVGSQTKQGAASTFLRDVLCRISHALGQTDTDLRRKLSASFLVSCDNAHGVHPNHPEHQDKNHAVYPGAGIVIKYNANQRYTSDAVSAALFQLVCDRADVPYQRYANRADMPGGSTLGNIANTQVSLNTVDIGLAQFAMHSAYETAGAADTTYLVRALTAFYEASITTAADGVYTLE